MKIAFFTEMGFTGKIPRTHENMRTEFAWMVALNSDHYNINSTPNQQYDLGIIIIPKTNPNFNINQLKNFCNKVAVIWYYNTLVDSDIIFTHNYSDKNYYEGLTGHKDVRIMKSLMIEDAIGELKEVKRDGVIIGGNFVNWYGGFDSYIVAQEISDTIYAPSMGRKQPGEEELVTHLPYMNWKQWIHKLNEFEIGIHLMRTQAAGTFALNCAYLGIPCIGYKGLDTQESCHPDLTVEIGNLKEAKNLAKKLRNNQEFYVYCSQISKQKFKEHYSENNFII